MGLLDRFKRLIRFKSISNQSITQSNEQIQPLPTQTPSEISVPEPSTESSQLTLEKESLQLGIAAGYTGRTIRDIDSSLSRMESQMVTKDWFAIKLDEALQLHEQKNDERFKSIESQLTRIMKIFDTFPTSKIIETVAKAVSEIKLSRKLNQLIKVVRETGEIKYSTLALKLNISEDALRGYLSRVAKRTNQIERFRKEGKEGWVRFVQPLPPSLGLIASESNQSITQPQAKQGN